MRRRARAAWTAPALAGVLVREVVNFGVLLALVDVLVDGRADDLPARLRLRLRLAGLAGQRPRLRRVRRHRHGRDGGAVLVGLPGDVRHVRQVREFQRTYDAILAAPVDTEELVTAEALWIARAPASTAARRCSWRWSSGWTRRWGMLLVPFIAFSPGFGWASFGILDRGGHEVDRQLQLRDVDGAHAAVPGRRHVLPDLRPARVGAGRWPTSTRCTTASQLVRDAVFGLEAGPTCGTSAFLVAFGAGRLAPGDQPHGEAADRLGLGAADPPLSPHEGV